MGARREITASVVDRYRLAVRPRQGTILDELCAVTGRHRKHAVRALATKVSISREAQRRRRPTYGPRKDALVALWETSLYRFAGQTLGLFLSWPAPVGFRPPATSALGGKADHLA
jgi:hypothetical protein